ncbi:MAG: hypothetical protein KJP25_06600 [Gammaproteobacteria bacterium]|nr:hypothetical protein [Gammaproteobacteria bacterium]MBT8151090.1 hypothetical protein [Gammaproteobacteria bacterium]NND39548.1 hypothetical protein [Pseudomonadales bacterium]NNM11837.1 hypothetical protein [Pseudomonadales bacterium]RZV53300.1 MAG: hypothetical protein EX270_08875 [Pseudomonadales bacterium]
MPLPLANATALPASLPRAEPGLAREQSNAKKQSAVLHDEASKPQRLPNKDSTPAQPSLNALALALAEDQNLSRQQSLALGSYLQAQSLSVEPVESGRELLVGVDTFA